jgi:ribonuclease-3 family protein
MDAKKYLPFSPALLSEAELNQMNPVVLSFVGDSVQTLYVRASLASESSEKAGALHRKAAALINATSQAAALKRILNCLQDKELSVYKRCRNAKKQTSAKNSSLTDYRTATGFEGVVGYLYLAGRHDRLAQLLELAYNQEIPEQDIKLPD